MGSSDGSSEFSVPNGYATVDVEFTVEERKAVERTLQRFATIANSDAPPGTKAVVPHKVIDGFVASGLAEYAQDLLLFIDGRELDDRKLTDLHKAAKAQMKAYAVHNLPIYLFQAATILETAGDLAGCNEFLRTFLHVQNSFNPDQVDQMFMSHSV